MPIRLTRGIFSTACERQAESSWSALSRLARTNRSEGKVVGYWHGPVQCARRTREHSRPRGASIQVVELRRRESGRLCRSRRKRHASVEIICVDNARLGRIQTCVRRHSKHRAGGPGSGRRQRYSRRTTEQCMGLDIPLLQRRGLLRPGRSGSLSWSRGGERGGFRRCLCRRPRRPSHLSASGPMTDWAILLFE